MRHLCQNSLIYPKQTPKNIHFEILKVYRQATEQTLIPLKLFQSLKSFSDANPKSPKLNHGRSEETERLKYELEELKVYFLTFFAAFPLLCCLAEVFFRRRPKNFGLKRVQMNSAFTSSKTLSFVVSRLNKALLHFRTSFTSWRRNINRFLSTNLFFVVRKFLRCYCTVTETRKELGSDFHRRVNE